MIAEISSQSSAISAVNGILRGLSSAHPSGRVASARGASTIESSSSLQGKSELTEEERKEVEELKRRDQEVRRHEAAHKAAAGSAAKGAPTFEFTTGPDGRRYATGGEVKIDTSEVSGDPQATIAKMQQIRRAATAPAEPSSQDQRVAAEAAAKEAEARRELAVERRVTQQGQASNPGNSLHSVLSGGNGETAAGRFIDVTV